ncbi:hypothetical protein NDU88_005886 [Pleurodeles waltl]|uniref:Uncharacterized protein n=1 Tax=Pleurodeles waltl TaxID=8319 RepID=A0AAV7L260_PLEWA|nr:hypothetical protein NDU88_005886 [Pleurodeles waltl]
MSGSRLSPREMRAVREKDLVQGSGAGAGSVTCELSETRIWNKAAGLGQGQSHASCQRQESGTRQRGWGRVSHMRAVRDKDLEQGSGAGQGQSHARISRMSGSRLSPREMRAAGLGRVSHTLGSAVRLALGCLRGR